MSFSDMMSGAVEQARASSPSSIYANMTREQFADTQKRFLPLQKLANEMVLDPTKRAANRAQGLGIANDAVDTAFDNSTNRMETLRSRTNQQQSKRSLNSASRLDALQRTATTVNARNQTNQYMDERELELIGG